MTARPQQVSHRGRTYYLVSVDTDGAPVYRSKTGALLPGGKRDGQSLAAAKARLAFVPHLHEVGDIVRREHEAALIAWAEVDAARERAQAIERRLLNDRIAVCWTPPEVDKAKAQARRAG